MRPKSPPATAAAASTGPAEPQTLREWGGLFWAALQRFLDVGGMRQGAAVAFYAAFSMAPMLVVVTGVMVWLLGQNGAESALLSAARQMVGDSESAGLRDWLAMVPKPDPQQAADRAWVASTIALGTTLIGATGIFVELRSAVQAMLNESDADSQRAAWWMLVQVRLLALGVVIGCGFLLAMAMLVQTAALVALKWLATQWPLLTPLLTAFEGLWSWAVIMVLFATMTRFLPNRRPPWRAALAGAAVGATLFLAGRYGISAYIATTATSSAIGAAGSFAALLVWVYWSSQIFLVGTAITAELTQRQRRTLSASDPTTAQAAVGSP